MAQYLEIEDIAIDGKSIRSTITNVANSEQNLNEAYLFFWTKKSTYLASQGFRK